MRGRGNIGSEGAGDLGEWGEGVWEIELEFINFIE